MDVVVCTMELDAAGLEALLARARSGSSHSTVGCLLEALSTPRYAQAPVYTSDSSVRMLRKWGMCFQDISCVCYVQVTCQRGPRNNGKYEEPMPGLWSLTWG